MKKNVGSIDSYLRIAVGVVLIVLAFLGTIGPWGYLGIIPIITGLFSFCALYKVLGINTLGKK